MINFLVCFLIFTETDSSVQHSCRDESNKPVDWFVAYKLPKIRGNENRLVDEGKAYAYMTSKDNTGWTLSKKPITDKSCMFANTLAPIYGKKAKQSLMYILYNDQQPGDKTHSNGGHAKGVLVADKTGGFWLVHSVPRFAPIPTGSKKYSYPSNGITNGQSFLCVTLEPHYVDLVGSQLYYNELHIYAKSVPTTLTVMYPKFTLTSLGDDVNKPPWNSKRSIVSASGSTQLLVFAKSEKYHKELYSDWVAPELGVSLVVQTWPNGRTHQSSSCGRKYRVENVEEIKIAGVTFTSTKDHSKWAASESKSKPWVCIGDINKDDSQEKRGGGTVCLKEKSLWQAYYNSAVEVKRCKKKKKMLLKDYLTNLTNSEVEHGFHRFPMNIQPF